MRLGKLPPGGVHGALPAWPPVLAARGPGARSTPHAHHAMHVVLAVAGEVRFRAGARGTWQAAAGIVTAPDVVHAIDTTDADTLLVFVDPESEHGRELCAHVSGVTAIDAARRDALLAQGADPMAIMTGGSAAWTAKAVAVVAGTSARAERRVHPRVRRLLRELRELPPDADTSLEALAARVKLSPDRLMHVFTASIGTPLRPYLAWLRLQRASAAIVSGAALTDAALAAGFADAAHMTRTFRRMLGATPSSLRQPVRSSARPRPSA